MKGEMKMVTSNGNFKINISEEERKGLIKNFKIGVLNQLHKEGYISSMQLEQMVREIQEGVD
jgi:hypothetical protein